MGNAVAAVVTAGVTPAVFYGDSNAAPQYISGFTGFCNATGGGLAFPTPGPQALIAIMLPAGAPSGSILTVDTCDGGTDFDTEVFIGNGGCPTSVASFGCLFSNDDNAAQCGAGSKSSYASVVITGSEPMVWVLVAPYDGIGGTYGCVDGTR